MAKQLNVNLAFTADTKQAQQQIAQLQKSLDGLLSKSIENGAFTGFNKDISNAQQSVLKLKTVINSSLNADTGRLDLSKFNMQLNNSGLSIGKLASDMSAMGSDGQKAFLNLANSIVTAQKPMLETNKLLDGMWTALKNTARWQLSSSILHGFVGSLQGAYGYAQDLNQSLNNIRIVTGQSTDQMAAFADQANKSAQALSTSTLAYADAALIYYQQGLGDEEVQARTETTLKMSNVTRDSVEEVSSYMTAIWNNFAEGADNLELFADKITALGAATASSSAEIAQGLQQFSALGSSLGLNYDDAVAALATVVAQTRQSASTVGNSFRTLFQRIESLKLGETLEDGVELTKYSKALEAVGVQVLDVNGEMRDMHDVIQDLGAVWQDLSRAQQNALAQTVGGVRNSNTLIAWMDNFEKFQENLNVSYNAEGTLEEQAEIYAESWEAARKRVQAAWQALYQDFIDEKFFIGIANGVEKVLQVLDKFVDSAGGLPGVLSLVAAGITKAFGPQLTKSLESAQLQLSKILKPAGSERTYADIEADELVDKTLEAAIKNRTKIVGKDSAQQDLIINNLNDQLALNKQLRNLRGKIADKEYEELEGLIKITGEYAEQAQKLEEIRREKSLQANKSISNIRDKMTDANVDENSEAYKRMKDLISGTDYKAIKAIASDTDMDNTKQIDALVERYSKYGKQVGVTASDIRKFIEDQVALRRATEQANNAINAQEGALKNLSDKGLKIEKKDTPLFNISGKKTKSQKNFETNIDELFLMGNQREELEKARNNLQEEFDVFKDAYNDSGEFDQNKAEQYAQRIKEINQEIKNLNEEIEQKVTEAETNAEKLNKMYAKRDNKKLEEPKESEPTQKPFWLSEDFAKGTTKAFQGISQITMGLSAMSNVVDTLNNKELTPMEKVSRVVPSLAMAIPMLIGGVKSLGVAMAYLTGQEYAATLATKGLAAAKISLTKAFVDLYLPLLAIAIAVGVVVAAIKKASDAYNTDAIAAEKAAKKAEETAEAFNKAKTEFDSLKSALESHQDSVNALNELKQGTDEWYESVAKLNEEVLDLINQYPELAKYVQNINGSLQLSKEGMQEYLNTQYRELHDARANDLVAQNEKRETKIESDKTNLSRSIQYQTVDNNGYINTTSSNLDTATATRKELNAAMAALQDVSNLGDEGFKEFAEALEKDGIKNEDLINALWDHKDSILELSQAIEENKDINEANKDLLIQSDIQNEMGQTIDQILSNYENGEVFADDIKSRFAEVLSKRFEADELSSEEYVRALQGLKDELTKNFDKVMQDLESQNISNIGETLKSNGMQFSNMEDPSEEIRQKLESDFFTKEQRKILIEYGIDEDAKSWEDVRQSAQEKADELKKILHDTPVEIDTDGLSKKQAEEVKKEFADLTEYIKNNATEIDELDDHLAECTLESSRLARAIIRFDDAIQDVTDNYDDWNRALKSGSMQAATKAAEEMRKTYGNLLDIDGSVLSDSFLRSAENLDLMKEALNGSEKAYNQLAEAANQNILDNLQLSPEALTNFNNQLENVKSMMTDFPNLEVGADLDTGDFLRNLTDLVNAAGMTAAQAEAYLANMGIDATVTEHDATAEETQETASFQPTLIPKEVQGSVDTIDGDVPKPVPLNYTVYGVQYEPIPDTITTQKENKSFSLEVTSAHKSSGGGFKYNHANHGGGGAGSGKKGGSCFASGTLVTTDHNYKNIEDIKVGDTVLSYNEKTKKNEYSKVLQTMIHNVYEKIYDLFVKDDKLKVTGNHRFLVVHNNEQKWIEAADLQVGDLVLFANGTLHQISKIKTQTRFITVYNFEVSNTHNYYVGESQILAHNKGGGGSKAKKKEVKEPKKHEKNEDRYHDLKEQLEDVRLEYDKMNKAKDRAFGKSKLKYLDLEIKKLEQEDKILKDYVKEAERYAKIDRANLEGINMGAKFDENGALTNYEQVLQNILNDYNKQIDIFNKAQEVYNKSAQEEADKEILDKAQKELDAQKEIYDDRLKKLKQYEDTYNTWQEKVWEEIQKRWEIYDAKLEKVTLNVEVELSFNEDALKLLEFVFDHMGESADEAVDKIANLNKQMDEYDDNIKHIRSGLEGIFANHGIDINLNNMNPDEIAQQLVSAMDDKTFASELTEEEGEQIREYIDGLMDNTKKLEESFDNVFETIKEGYDQWNERLQDQMAEYDRLNQIVSSYKDLASLTSKDVFELSYDDLKKWNKELINNAENQAKSAEKIWQDNQVLYQNAVKAYQEAETEEEKKKWKEIMDQRKQTTDEAHQDYLDKVNEWQEAIQNAFDEALDYAKEKYEKSFGDLNLNFIESEYERLADLDKLYLKPYEKYHDLEKSLKELGKSITDTTNPTVLNKMLSLQDEINDKMANGAQMSAYETGIIERRVALLQAEAELQNAKNAKSAVRMTRDNEGNFSYTYTANQDAIDDAQANLSENFYELLKFERDSLNEIQDRILQETRTYQEALDDLARTYGKDSEEYQKYAEIVTNDHIEKMQYLESQSDMLYGEMARLRDDDWKDLERIFDLKLADTEDFLTFEEETLLGGLFGEEGIFPTIKAGEEQYLADIKADVEQYGAETQQVVDNVSSHIKADIADIGKASDEAKKSVHDLGENMKQTMLDADNAGKGIADKWAEHMKKVRDDTTNTTNNLNNLLTKLDAITTAQKSLAAAYDKTAEAARKAATAQTAAASSDGGSGGGGNGGSSSGGGNQSTDNGSTPKLTYTKYSWKKGGPEMGRQQAYAQAAIYGTALWKVDHYSNGTANWTKEKSFESTASGKATVTGAASNIAQAAKTRHIMYDSGGYTGDWGDSSGKLAVLHRKEIVLNKEDTSNFLDAIGIVRSIKDFVDTGARNLGNIFNYNVMAGAGTTDLQQQVHIDASFPNVQSHSEIELALNNLINSASQYVNRKR